MTDYKAIKFEDPQYPSLLKNLTDAPQKLYVRGDPSCLSAHSIAIVGSRNSTPYGDGVAREFAYALAQAGIITVSGLAKGIDTAAHQGSLKGGGKTIAVMGTGPDMVFPRENLKLSQDIAQHGAVITEFEPGTPGLSWNFPLRNRIIAALSLGTVVIEAAYKSGALITARLAAELGKDVFAVPGPITSTASEGPNRLLANGAKLVTKAEDIFDEILELKHLIAPKKRGKKEDFSVPALTTEEQDLLNLISFEPVSIDLLIKKTDGGAGRISNTLLSLELKGAIQSLPGKRYAKKN